MDTRIVNEAAGKIKASGSGAYGVNKGIIYSQKSVGGWPELNSAPAPADTDHDGMPDSWEKARSLDPANPDDRNKVSADGYTMLEMYLNGLLN